MVMPRPPDPPSVSETIVKAALAAIPYAGGSLVLIYEDSRERYLGVVVMVLSPAPIRGGLSLGTGFRRFAGALHGSVDGGSGDGEQLGELGAGVFAGAP